ncbi:MAG: EAL domain-containing protein, partial [Gammaproteobacteria bacterium]
NLPADELKIDRSFVTGITADETDRRVAESVVRLGHAVGLEVVAEGIEDAATQQALASMDCDTGQGYHLGRPVNAADFENRWRTKEAGSTASAPEPARVMPALGSSRR